MYAIYKKGRKTNMKKILTLVPAALLTACTLASCGGNKYVNKLDEFVRNLKGDVTIEALENDETGIYREGIFDAGDKMITKLTTSYINYSPRWNWVDGLEESEYEELVRLESTATSFTRYNDNKVRMVEDSLLYPYNKDAIGDDSEYPECIDYENPSEMASETVIWEANGVANYVYTAINEEGEGDPSDPWSFKTSRDTAPKLMSEIGTLGGNSPLVLTDIAGALEVMDAYESLYVEYYPLIGHERIATVEHQEGKLHVRLELQLAKDIDFEGNPVVPLSSEAIWGSEFKGLYFKQYRSYYYDYTVNDGIIESAKFGFGGVARLLYKDRNWKEGDPTPHYPLTIAEQAMLDLYVPEKVMWPDSETGEMKEIDNPYTGQYAKIAPGGNPFEEESFTASSKSQGNYTKTLPTLDDYREGDASDEGSMYLSMKDFLELDPEA